MKQPPRLSEAEWEVMKVVWQRSPGPSSASEVIAALSRSTVWSAATVKTLLNRLLHKGALRHEKAGKAYLYFPACTEKACRGAATESFLQRVFDGSLSPLLAHFASSRRLSRAELDELESLLRKKKGTK